MRIRLSDEDRKQYAVDDEWLVFDEQRLTAKEAALLQTIGYDTPGDWYRALRGEPVVGADGPEHLRRVDGELLLDKDGQPVPKIRRDWLAECSIVWMALRRAGHPKLSWDDCDVDIRSLRVESEPDPEVEAGKDQSTPPDPSP